ncbi:MAG: helix-turn-helix domain-containing protein, partial [Planctomycetes bacterium]|nr:helix-turn-helix domain-containing protein [Planctomycetota bacterium]
SAGPGTEAHAEFLTTRQLMDFLQLSRTKIWELVQKEGLPAFKIGGDYRYLRSEVLAWLEKYRVRDGGKERSDS